MEYHDAATGALTSSFNNQGRLVASDTSGDLYFVNPGVGIYKTSPTGQLVWQYNRFGVDWPLTVDADGRVYCGDQSGNVIGISASGSEMWEVHLSNKSLYNTAPVIGPHGQLFVLEQDQIVTALTSVPEPGTVVLLTSTVACLIACRLALQFVRPDVSGVARPRRIPPSPSL